MEERIDQINLREATVGQIARRDLLPPDMVTSVIEHDVDPAFGAKYEAWLKKITPIAARFPGHQGITILRPTERGGRYTLLLRFATLEQAQDWFQSAARKALIAEVEPYLTRGENIEIKTGLEFWFKPPAGKTAPSPFEAVDRDVDRPLPSDAHRSAIVEHDCSSRADLGQSVRCEPVCGRDHRRPADLRVHASRHTLGQRVALRSNGLI